MKTQAAQSFLWPHNLSLGLISSSWVHYDKQQNACFIAKVAIKVCRLKENQYPEETNV